MKIYIGHSTDLKYEEKLYRPLRNSSLTEEHELIFPHGSTEFFDSKEFLREECDLFMAEVSRASTGLGIELGWAEQFDVRILCICRENSNPSSSLKAVIDDINRYKDEEDLVETLETVLS